MPPTSRVMMTALMTTALLGAAQPAVAATSAPSPSATASAPAPATAGLTRPVSSHGITVTGMEKVGERTWRIDISTPAVNARYATKEGMSVRVTLPADYATSAKRYSTLYLLHGLDGSSADWTHKDATKTNFGDVEKITAGKDVIVVMPDGGKAGWYTDWVRQLGGAQAWETFHVKQLIPFIDASLRTKADGRHRAIAGLSMGGFGALHYATAYPGMFAHASSYSGAVNTSLPALRVGVIGGGAYSGLLLDAPFGNATPGLDDVWHQKNPYDQAASLRGTGVSLYTGDGKNGRDAVSKVLEVAVARATATMDARLTALDIPHTYVPYGHDVTKAGYACNGGHEWACWNMALALDLPAILSSIGAGN